MRKNVLILSVVIGFVSLGCQEKRESLLPNVDVYITISLTLPQFESLNYPGNVYVYSDRGYLNNGVYVVRMSPNDFAAFDVTCTDHLDKVAATRLEGGVVAKCPECKEEYQLLNYGYNADESKHLQQYRVERLEGGNVIVVRN